MQKLLTIYFQLLPIPSVSKLPSRLDSLLGDNLPVYSGKALSLLTFHLLQFSVVVVGSPKRVAVVCV